MNDAQLLAAAARMSRDWNERARQDAERFIYTRDQARDVAGFDESGLANYNQLLRPFLPVLLDGRGAGRCRALEIGCGVGRILRWAAVEFGEVHGVDVAPAMIELARERLSGFANIGLHRGSGYDLAFAGDESFDLVFSYLVFQHIPVRAAVANYIREAGRILKPGGAFKFQLNGDQSPDYIAHERDTWQGETFSREETQRMIADAGLEVQAAEGMGTQYFVLTCRKAPWRQPLPSPYILPGEPWAAEQLREGWGAPVGASWRPLAARSRTVLAVPEGRPRRFFLGLYFWPAEGADLHTVEVTVGGLPLGRSVFESPGDQYLEFDVPGHWHGTVEVAIDITPACESPVRALGLYAPKGLTPADASATGRR
jgi:SAM-dependent methyltransferase